MERKVALLPITSHLLVSVSIIIIIITAAAAATVLVD